MLILFDNGTPRTLARYLIHRHSVTEARALGWDELENGDLLMAAEAKALIYSSQPTRIFATSRISLSGGSRLSL